MGTRTVPRFDPLRQRICHGLLLLAGLFGHGWLLSLDGC
jgi:hypothetical protein